MTDLTVSKTILSQLGGGKFVAMTGAKNLTGSDNSLSFKIGRNAKGVTHVRITLTPDDLYTMEFLRIRDYACRTVDLLEEVTHDSLPEVFTRATGMDTRL